MWCEYMPLPHAPPTLHRGAVVVVLWMVAMAIGVLYKRFVMGAKGWEQVPLLEIYREFGNLEAVSVQTYLISTVTHSIHLCRMAVTLCVEADVTR